MLYNKMSGKEERVANRIHIISQEIKITKLLASNNPQVRYKQLKKLKTWLKVRANSSFAFTEDDFIRIWKGLYSSMWMSDKPLVQEALAEEFGKFYDCFPNIQDSLLFFRAFLQVIGIEWYGLDQFRMDKMLMLVRKMLRNMFHAMTSCQWSLESIESFNTHLTDTVLNKPDAVGLAMHVTDIFLEELAKVGGTNLTGDAVAKLVATYINFMIGQSDMKLMGHIKERIFFHLLWQSPQGRDHNEKFDAWKRMGFPTQNIDDIERIEAESEDESYNGISPATRDGSLDPRAGNVDVFIPIITFDVALIINYIKEALTSESNTTKSKKVLELIKDKYSCFAAGEFPLGVKQIPKPDLEPMKYLIDKKVDDLAQLESDLYSTTRALKTLNKKQRTKLLASINTDEVDEEEFEKVLEMKLQKRVPKFNMKWHQENTNEIHTTNENHDDLLDTSSGTWEIESETQTEPDQSKELQNQNGNSPEAAENEWNKPLENGEIEYVVKSRKRIVEEANADEKELVLNPFALKMKKNEAIDAKNAKRKAQDQQKESVTVTKKVKIALNKNRTQKVVDYVKQVMTSPIVPYDANKQPGKSVLKANLLPSPINPFFKL